MFLNWTHAKAGKDTRAILNEKKQETLVAQCSYCLRSNPTPRNTLSARPSVRNVFSPSNANAHQSNMCACVLDFLIFLEEEEEKEDDNNNNDEEEDNKDKEEEEEEDNDNDDDDDKEEEDDKNNNEE